jgi:hypothetical protein
MKKVYQPARRVITRRAVIQNGRFASRKMGRAIDFESPVERDFLFLAEYDRQVVGIWEQPLKVTVELDSKWRNKYPDFKLLMRNGDIRIHEIKPKTEADKPENQTMFSVLEEHLAEVGIGYYVSLDTDIRKEPRLPNIKALARYALIEPKPEDLLWLQLLMDEAATVTIGDLTEGRPGRLLSKPAVYGLMFRGDLEIDIDLPLSDETFLLKGVSRTERYTGAEPEVLV